MSDKAIMYVEYKIRYQDGSPEHTEMGWVYKFNKSGTVDIRCDDKYAGNRGLTIPAGNITRIVPGMPCPYDQE